MAEENQSCISHVSLGTNDYERAKAFYGRVLKVIGCKLIMEHPGAAAFGKAYPEFWINSPFDSKPATAGNGTHVGFAAQSKAEVDLNVVRLGGGRFGLCTPPSPPSGWGSRWGSTTPPRGRWGG